MERGENENSPGFKTILTRSELEQAQTNGLTISEEIYMVGKVLRGGNFEYKYRYSFSEFALKEDVNVLYNKPGSVSIWIGGVSIDLTPSEKRYLISIIEDIIDNNRRNKQQEARNKIKSVLGENK